MENRGMFELKEFVGDAASICREERQYALFLYNYICRLNDEKEDSLKLREELLGDSQARILGVFYEATFMRDFFERDRRLRIGLKKEDSESKVKSKLEEVNEEGCKLKDLTTTLVEEEECFRETRGLQSFNEKLLRFLLRFLVEKFEIPKETFAVCGIYINRNWGTNSFYKEEPNSQTDDGSGTWTETQTETRTKEMEAIITLARAMMNAKPDIAVWYQKENAGEQKQYLQFLECKYCSNESSYKEVLKALEWLRKDKINEEAYSKGQVVIQNLIAQFLCEEILKNDVQYCNTQIIRFRGSCNAKSRYQQPGYDIKIEELMKEYILCENK